MEKLSFDKLVFILAMGSSTRGVGSRIAVGIVGNLQPGLNTKLQGRNHEHRGTCLHEVIVQVVVFSLADRRGM